ncbi:MAG TPA: VOC family protein [Jiangellales bacterium]|nr:VOC family protein [Jiangellales bacterium]
MASAEAARAGSDQGQYGIEVALRTGTRLVGVDFSAAALEQARSISARRLPPGRSAFKIGTLIATGLPTGVADGLMCVDAVQFADPPLDALVESRRLLASGGRLALTCWEAVDPSDERVAPRPERRPGCCRLPLTRSPNVRRLVQHDGMTKLTGQQIADEALDGWVYLLGGLQTRLHTPDFAAGLEVVNAIGAVAARLQHYPDLDLRPTHVDIRLTSHDLRAVTDQDIRLAREISSIVTNASLTLECRTVSRVELALDTPSFASILPFWRAALALADGVDPKYDNDLLDPFRALPAVWFQTSGSEEPRQRWHLDVWLDPAEVEARIEAARAAGGTVVNDREAPSFWVLADPDGNKVCLCTWQDRD